MSKQIKSKLDQYAVTLLDMDDAKATIAEIQKWLKEEGCVVSTGRIAEFLASLRQSRLQSRLLGQIASGAEQCKEVEKQFGKNPAPELETLMKLHRVLILQLSTQGNADPEFLKLADQLTNTVLNYKSGQTKFQQKERELNLAEEKFQFNAAKACLKEFPKLKVIATNKTLSEAEKTQLFMDKLFGKKPDATGASQPPS